jgi:hypothetical protein
MNINTFIKYSEQKNWIPDSVYTICGENTQDCTICSNNLYSNAVNGMVHDSQRGKVFCPFGEGESMNQPIFGDQGILNSKFIQAQPNWGKTTWGHVPQMDPRPLTKIGLTWRTS